MFAKTSIFIIIAHRLLEISEQNPKCVKLWHITHCFWLDNFRSFNKPSTIKHEHNHAVKTMPVIEAILICIIFIIVPWFCCFLVCSIDVMFLNIYFITDCLVVLNNYKAACSIEHLFFQSKLVLRTVKFHWYRYRLLKCWYCDS